jgi:hypothetical protein
VSLVQIRIAKASTEFFEFLNLRELMDLVAWSPKNSPLSIIFEKCKKNGFSSKKSSAGVS